MNPWKLGNVLHNANGSRVVEGFHPMYLGSDWALKFFGPDGYPELSVILALAAGRTRIRHTVELPRPPLLLFGRGPNEDTWYAMRRYRTLQRDEYATVDWRRLVREGLEFLCDFHHALRKVYMDFKPQNTFLTADGGFIFGDYGSADVMWPQLTETYNDDSKWYYVARGAELNETLFSWRYDLTALGYLAAQIAWNPDTVRSFEDMCQRRRVEPSGTQEDNDIIHVRDQEMAAGAPREILEYLTALHELPWDSRDPPSVEFYGRLKKFVD